MKKYTVEIIRVNDEQSYKDDMYFENFDTLEAAENFYDKKWDELSDLDTKLDYLNGEYPAINFVIFDEKSKIYKDEWLYIDNEQFSK